MGATKFVERVIPHDALKEEIARDLRRWGYEVLDNGRENTHPTMDISYMNDPGAKEIRFKPDLTLIANGRVVFVDPKNSVYIEKDPYLYYRDMASRGIPVYVCCAKGNERRFSHISDLELAPPYHKIWPIDCDGWISPREHPNYTEYKYSYPLTGKPYKGSGTPFRLIEFGSMASWGPIYFSFDVNSR